MAGAGILEHHHHLSLHPSSTSTFSTFSTSSPRLGSLENPRMMSVGADFVVQSPTAMAQQDQLPSPLTLSQAGRGSLPQQADMSHQLPHAKMRRKSHAIKVGVPSNNIKRSASTPNVRGMSTAPDHAAAALAEKRRNKLGYHRTSVACVHCRRRKIRCLLAPDDPQKRCSNCIRLKKDCNFYPVDQQPPQERRPRTGSKHDAIPGDTSTSSSSSPSMQHPHAGDHTDFTYAHMPMSANVYSTTPMSLGPLSSTMSPPGSAAPMRARFDVQEHSPHVGWDPRFFTDSQQIPTGQGIPEESSNGGYWKVPEQPNTPQFSPYSSGPPSSMFQQGSFSSYSSTPSRAENGWQPQPMRSMSYTQVDEPHQRHDSYPSPYPHELRRQTVDMLPPSQPPSLHHSSVTSSTSSMPESPAAPLSGGPSANQAMMHPYNPPGWQAVPQQSPKTVDFGNGWYQEPSQLSKVQEEDAHYSDHHQANMYPGGGNQH